MKTAGLHHITAVTKKPQTNIDFYQQVLGQRMVKTTINFDDPSVYHLYYGDNSGIPGTAMTFFGWLRSAQGKVGTAIFNNFFYYPVFNEFEFIITQISILTD